MQRRLEPRRRYGIQLETAQHHLDMWIEAEIALTTSQSYTIGSQVLTRADLAKIGARIDYWEEKVKELEAEELAGKRNRVHRIVPRDQ